MGNPQMMLYALGALELFDGIYDIETVRMTIFQPRRENVSVCVMAKADLLQWAYNDLMAKAKLAYEGGGEFACGDWCRFCKAKAACRKRAEYNLELAWYDFAMPDTLENAEIAAILGGEYWIESKQQAVGAAEEFLDLQLEDAKDEVQRTREALLDQGVAEEYITSGGKALEKKIESGQMEAYLAYMSAMAYKAFVMKRRDMKYVVSALQAAKPMLEISVSDLDRDGFLLNTPDGTYYLPDGLEGRRDHSPEDYITKITAAAPGDKGKELWIDALNTIFCGDAALISYVKQIVGMAAVGRVYLESLIIAYGEGRNGKSTFWNAIARVLGTYSGNMSADTLTVGCKRNVKPELAEAKGKRLIIAVELEEGMRLNTSVVKQMCSTDEIFAEKKYKDPFSFTPSHTLVLYTNHLPRVGANDPGTWRRLIVIPFNARIEGSGDVKNYADFLVSEAAPAIMAWIIEGAKMAIDRNFHIPCPACVEDAIKSYREDNDWLGHFLNDCCEVDVTYREKSGELYQEYRSYCARTGEYARSTADFYNALESAGFRRQKTKTGNFICGLRIAEDF